MKLPRHISLLPIPRLLVNSLVGVLFVAATISMLLDNKGGANLKVRSPAANGKITRLSGLARIVDGDTIRLNGQRIRILGIDAPEMKQTCAARNGAQWACGEKARQYLLAMLANANISCESRARDIYTRLLARCTLDGVDIGATMVRSGMAVSYYDYKPEERLAKAERRGLWQGKFVKPRAWRNARK